MRTASMRDYRRPAAVMAGNSMHEACRFGGHMRPMTAGDGLYSSTTSPPSSSNMMSSMPSPRPTTAPNGYMWGKAALPSPPRSAHQVLEEAGLSLEDRFPFLRDDRKRTRKLLTQEQTRLLEAILERTVYPSTPLREAIARYLGISPRKVQIWFQNKRQISRRFAHPGPVRGCGGDHVNAIMARVRRATEGSEGYESSDRLMRYQSAEEDLRLAGLVDSEGRHFPELQFAAARDNRVPATALGEAPWSERFHPRAPYDADYIEVLRSRQRHGADEDVEGDDSSSSGDYRRHSSFEVEAAPPAPVNGNFTRILPPPRRQSYMARRSAQLAGRNLASLSDIALRHPEQVPALLSPTSPHLLSPIVFREPHWRTHSATTDNSDAATDHLSSRADNLRSDSPTSSQSSTTTSPITPKAPGSQGYHKSYGLERCDALPSIASLIFD